MLKNKSKLVVLLFTLIMLFSTFSFATEEAVVTSETQNVTSENTTTEENTTIEESLSTDIHSGDLYLFSDNVVMDQLVDGNVFIFGSNVEVTGRLNGSLFVFGEKVTLNDTSYVAQSIYACANELVVEGVATDLYALASKIDMSGVIYRDLRVATDNFSFSGGVGRDAFVESSTFNFSTDAETGAIIYGNLTYSSNEELSLSKELVVGNINYSPKVITEETKSVQEIILDKVMNFLETLLYTVVVFVLAVLLAPKFVEKSSSFIGTKSFAAFGTGLGIFILAIVVSFALLFSYIGIPLAFALFTLFVLMMSISFAVTATCITYKVKEKFNINKKYLTFITLIVVTLVLWALKLVPYVGGIISAIISLVGFGITLLYLFTKNKKDTVVSETPEISE